MNASPSDVRRPLWPVIAVVALALTLRIWVIARTEVAARDSIGFIKYALRYECEPFTKVLREAQQPPGYPLAVMAASWPVRAWSGDTTPHNMMLAAQVASAVFGVLLVFPMIGLGAELLDRRTGLVAAALFQCLPAWVKLTSDGLSEATFLFFVATALWAAARGLRLVSWRWLAGAGLGSGAAYLTRPEGAEVAAAVGMTVFGMHVLRQWTWRQTLSGLIALALGFGILFGPVVGVTGRFSNKPTTRFLLGDPAAEKSFFTVGAAPTPTGALFAIWWQDNSDPDKNRLLWAIEALVTEVATGARQIGLVLAVAGLFAWRRRISNLAGRTVLCVLTAMHAVLLVRMTSAMGYLSERHTALIIMAGCYPAALALTMLATRLARFRWRGHRGSTDVCLLALLTAGVATALPSLSKRLHYNRAGHRHAGEWLARHASPDAAICDPFCWAQYFAGRDFRPSPGPDANEQFVIIEANDNLHSRLPLMAEAKAKANAGTLVFSWPPTPAKSQVQVYRWLRPQTAPQAN